MSAPKPLWDTTTSRRERVTKSVVRGKYTKVTRVYDHLTIDDLVAFMARNDVAGTVLGEDRTPEVPRSIRDYLTKQGTTLTGS